MICVTRLILSLCDAHKQNTFLISPAAFSLEIFQKDYLFIQLNISGIEAIELRGAVV